MSTHEALHCNLNMYTFFHEIASYDQEDEQQLYREDLTQGLEEMNGMYVNFLPFI